MAPEEPALPWLLFPRVTNPVMDHCAPTGLLGAHQLPARGGTSQSLYETSHSRGGLRVAHGASSATECRHSETLLRQRSWLWEKGAGRASCLPGHGAIASHIRVVGGCLH